MRESITSPCDRCGKRIDGIRDEGMTAGYYDVTGGHFSRFARAGERVVCDRCMWTDPRYMEIYGTANALSLIEADTGAAGQRARRAAKERP
jgi:hypothetical protein